MPEDRDQWDSELFEFRSFQFDEGSLSIEVERCVSVAAGKESEAVIDARARVVDLHSQLHDVDDLDAVRLYGRVRSGATIGQRTAWLRVSCQATWYERHAPLELAGSEATFQLDLQPGDVRGTVSVRPMLVNSRSPDDGLVVAVGDAFEVWFDEPVAAFGGGLRTEWSTAAFVDRAIPNALSHVDVTESDAPVLYLNDGVRDFRILLSSRGSRGSAAKVRQLLLDSIEADTWFALGCRAASLAYRMGDGGVAELVDEEVLESWAGPALDKIGRFLGFGRDESTRAKAAGALLDPDQHDNVRSHIDSAVGGGGLRARLEALNSELPRFASDGEDP